MVRLGLVGSMIISFACLGGCAKPPASVEKGHMAVKVKPAVDGEGAVDMRYSGTLEAAAQVDVAFRAQGYVEVLGETAGKDPKALDIGDFVKKGTLLAKVRGADYAQRVASARAKSAEAKASAKLAEQDMERAKKLFETRVISRAEYDTKSAQHEAALASVDGASAAVGEASLALDDTVLRAPMDGVIVARNVELGTLAHQGAVAFVIADTRTVKAVFGVPEALVQKLHVGDPLSIVVGESGGESSATKPIGAPITRIAPAADSKGRLFTIETSIPNPGDALHPGSVVSIHVPDALRARGSLVVPLGSVIRSPTDQRGFAVFVVEGDESVGATRLREVALGDVVGNSVSVTHGLERGERVVTTGASLLTDGGQAVVIP